MKHSELSHEQAEITEIAQSAKETHKQLLAIRMIRPGHKLFKLSLETGLVSLVDDSEFRSYVTISGDKKRELVVKPMHLYDVCLNKKNAIRRFSKMMEERFGAPNGS